MPDQLHQLKYAVRRWPESAAYAPPPPRSLAFRVLDSLLRTAGWSFLALIPIYVVLGAVYGVAGIVLPGPALVLAVLMFPVTAVATRAIRRRRAATVLGYLLQGVRLNQPLHRILIAAARSERGRTQRRLNDLQEAIDAAAPLSVALARTVPEVPARTIGLIDYAERVGRLPETLEQLVHDNAAATRSADGASDLARWYPPVLLLVSCVVLSIYSIYVMPKLVAIFRDFHLAMPTLTRWAFQIGDGFVFVTPLVALVLLIVCGIQLQTIFRVRTRDTIFRGLIDRLSWQLPIAHELQLDRGMTDVCRAVASALSLGRPLEQALAETSSLQINRVLRQRIESWTKQLKNGNTPEDAARQARLPAFVVGMLATARSMPDQSAMFTFLSGFYGSRFHRRQALLQGALVPVIVFAMGVVVAAVALGVFLPLVRLTEGLSPAQGSL